MNSEEQQKGTHFLDAALNQEEETEAVLRPLTFSDFTGQRKTKERLEIIVGAARERGDVLNHVLISGPPGLGENDSSLRSRQRAEYPGPAHLRPCG